MTGRYGVRTGVPTVLGPSSDRGLEDSEVTVAQVLRGRGYRTMCAGKWHLGSEAQFLPTNRGFDEFFGMRYSHDLWPPALIRGADVVDPLPDFDTLTQRYTAEAVDFIGRSRGGPLFLYLAYNMPHIPLASSSAFRNNSGLGLYADAVQEIDWSVGQVLDALQSNSIDDRTMVMFTSDHGPWYEGSTGRLRGRKAQAWEGGFRVPFIVRYPGRVPAGLVTDALASNLDILPTLADLAGAARPPNPLDGVNIWPLISGERMEVEREVLLYFDSWTIECARLGNWKLHVARPNAPPWTPEPKCGYQHLPLLKPELYDLESDPEESRDVADLHPEIVDRIRAGIDAQLPGMPEIVRQQWNNVMNTPVEYTPCGAWPVRKT